MTKRFINADELELEYYDLSIHGTMAVKSVLPVFTDLLEKQPTADVVEVRHGRWIDLNTIEWQCSECNYKVMRWNNTPYCPNCGAKMDAEVKKKMMRTNIKE